MVLLDNKTCIDVKEQALIPCSTSDDQAWEKVKTNCATRGLELCTEEQYKKAYVNPYVALLSTNMYGYTSTTCNDGHILMKEQYGGIWGCHTNSGCWPNRYYRCCLTSKYVTY